MFEGWLAASAGGPRTIRDLQKGALVRSAGKFLLLGGYADSLLNFRLPLILALQKCGLEVHVGAPGLSQEQPVRRKLEALGLHVHDVPLRRTGTNPVRDAFTVWYLWRLMRRIEPDFFLGYTIKPVIYGSFAAWLANVPNRFALITGLGFVFEHGSHNILRKLAQKLYGLGLSHVALVFFQNPDDQSLFRQNGTLRPTTPSLVVNGSGVDLSHFDVIPVPQGAMRFLLIGRLLGQKGIREYAEAAKRVRRQHPEVRFALAGWVDENPDSIEQSELDKWVRDGIIEFLGRLSDVRPAIADCSVLVLPSYREGTPRSVLEAMAMGRAIITTDAPGCRETVVDGENGFLVPVKSVDRLQTAMLNFISDDQLAVRMGKKARQIAQEKYDVERVNASMLAAMSIQQE